MASTNSDSSDTNDLLSKSGNDNGNGNGNNNNANAAGSGHARPHSLSVQTTANAPVDAITSQLAALLTQQSHQYMNYNSTILLSLRPSVAADTAPDAANASSLHAHLADYHDFQGSDEDDRPLQPHVYELATKAYYYLRRTGQDQGIVLNSACSTAWTGQAEHRRLATRALLSLSANATVDPATGASSSKSHKLARQIQAAEFIIDAFGCVGGDTYALPTPRFGRYAEIQFNDRGRVAGYKTILYNLDLDTGRINFNLNGGPVNGIQNRERAFNAVRWLAAGASPNERTHLRLPEPAQIGLEKDQYDRERFGLLKQALKGFGFPKKAGE